jgi:hypothetical protein
VAANWAAAADKAADPAGVAAVVERALAAERPRLRYAVGGDARRAAVLRRLLPDSLLVRLVERTTRPEKKTPTRNRGRS